MYDLPAWLTGSAVVLGPTHRFSLITNRKSSPSRSISSLFKAIGESSAKGVYANRPLFKYAV
ncbi:MAG: hypothetical protein G5Z43_001326 [Caldisphaeraceae archaeon]|nr:hypothetical protein [Caldisphaeraceae archaeon]